MNAKSTSLIQTLYVIKSKIGTRLPFPYLAEDYHLYVGSEPILEVLK